MWQGKRWHEMNDNLAACKYSFRMGRALFKNNINAYTGKTYACDLKGKSILFHEKELNILKDAAKEDIRNNLEGIGLGDRIIVNVEEN